MASFAKRIRRLTYSIVWYFFISIVHTKAFSSLFGVHFRSFCDALDAAAFLLPAVHFPSFFNFCVLVLLVENLLKTVAHIRWALHTSEWQVCASQTKYWMLLRQWQHTSTGRVQSIFFHIFRSSFVCQYLYPTNNLHTCICELQRHTPAWHIVLRVVVSLNSSGTQGEHFSPPVGPRDRNHKAPPSATSSDSEKYYPRISEEERFTSPPAATMVCYVQVFGFSLSF